MRLSVDISGIRSFVGDIAALDMIKAAGFDAVDYSFHAHDIATGENYLENAKNIREHLDKIGLVCNQAHAPFGLTYGKPFDESNYQYLTIVRSIEAAAVMGADNIIVHAIVVPEGIENVTDTYEDYNYKFYKSLEPVAKKFGIKIAIENLFTYNEINHYHNGVFAKPFEMNSLLARLDSPIFGTCLDIGHAFISGTKPHLFIAGMKPGALRALHVQECTDGIGDKHMLPYLGFIDWESTAAALKEYKYDGDITFEIFKFFKCFPPECLEAALKLAESVGRHLIKLIEE